MAQTDWIGMRGGLETALKSEISKLVGGSIEDLEGPVRDAANRLVVAIRRGPTGAELVAEIQDELMLRMAEKKIAAKVAYSGVFDIVLGTGMNLLFSGAIAGLAAVKTN